MNKKLTKLLSIFLIAGLIGTGTAVGVAGCKKNKPSTPTNNNQTEQDITWNMKDHGTKPSDAAAQTSGGKVTRPAADPTDDNYDFGGWYKDSACTEAFDFNETFTSPVTVYAKWTAKSQGGGQDDPPGSGDAINIVKEFAQADYDAATENSGKKYIEIGTEIATGVSVAGKADLEIEANSKKIIYDGAEKSVAYRFKFGGNLFNDKAATADAEAYKELNRGLKVEVEKDATLVVYGTSGSGNKTAYISLAEGVTEGEGDEAVTKLTIKDTQCICWKNADMNAVVFELKAGKTYYVGSDTTTSGDANAANANIYYLEIKSEFDEGKGDKVDAATASCETRGNIAHYFTKYGRYLDDAGEVLNPNEVFSDALGHKWSYTAADVTAPDAETAGSVNLTCGNNSAHTKEFTLPALKANVYTRTPITTGNDAGKCTYTISCADVYDGNEKVDVITFVAETVAEAKTTFVDISEIALTDGDAYSSLGATAKDIGNGTFVATAGTKNGTEMGITSSLNAKFEDGALTMKDTHASDTLYAVIGFKDGSVKTEGVYRVAGKLNALAAGNWDPVQIVTDTDISSDQDSKMLFALSSDGNKNYAMRLGSESTRPTCSTLAVNATDKYDFRLDIDLDNHVASISLSLNGGEWETIRTVTDEAINKFAGVRFQTAGGERSFSVEKIAIYQQMEVDAVVGEYTFLEPEYTLNAAGTANELGYVLSTDGTLKIKADGTSVTDMYGTKLNGTWTKADGYYTGTVQTSPSQSMTMYTVHDEEKGIAYVYMVPTNNQTPVATILQSTPYMVFLSDEAELTQAVIDAIAAKNYGVSEPGERENPIVITELSTEDITATGLEQGDEVFYTYKNTGADAVQITVAAGDNTMMYKVTPITDGWNFANITESFQVAAGETILIAANAQEDGGISFVFRAYDPLTDGAVTYEITLDTDGIKVDCPASLKTNEDGTLAGKLPTLDNTATAEFMGWQLEDGTPVDETTVFDQNDKIIAIWNITIVTIEEKTFTYAFDKIPAQAENAHIPEDALVGTQNAWLKVVDTTTDYVAYRGPSNNRIELNNGGLQVYFGEEGGTLTLGVRSTGSSNKSLIGLKNAEGEYIAAKNASDLTPATVGAKVNGASNAEVELSEVAVGAYIITGGSGNGFEVVFEVTEAGWYTIYSDRTQTTRGIVIATATLKVNEYEVPEAEFTETSVTLDQTAIDIDEQASATVTADIETHIGVYVSKIEWLSADPEVATVEDGEITVLKKGEGDTVVIICKVTDSRGVEKTAAVTVTVNHVGATGVSITDEADDGTLKKDDTVQLNYEVAVEGEGEATDVAAVQWDSSDKSVATVDDDGLVTIKGSGTTNITVTITKLDGTSKTSEAYAITVAAVAATGLKDIAAVSVDAGKKVDIVVEVEPADANGYDLFYESDDTSVATVDNEGKVTGVAAGTTTVTVTLKIGEDTIDTKDCAVTVTTAQVIKGTLQPIAGSTGKKYTDVKNEVTIITISADYEFVSRGDVAPADGWWTAQNGAFTITNNSTEDLYVTVTAGEVDGKGFKTGSSRGVKITDSDGKEVQGLGDGQYATVSIVIKAGTSATLVSLANKLVFQKIEYTSVIPVEGEGEGE